MITTTKLIIGISVCIADYVLNKNKVKIWKQMHKSEYIYLTKSYSLCGVYSNYDSWVTSNAWSCDESRLKEKYENTLELLYRDRIYQQAPFEIQIETENLIYEDYLWSRKLAGCDEKVIDRLKYK